MPNLIPNTIKTEMLSVLTQAESIESGYTTVLEQYAVEPERLQADVSALMNQWLIAGVAELHKIENKMEIENKMADRVADCVADRIADDDVVV
jgi:hypothetical protein